MAETRTEVAIQYRIYSKHVVALRIIKVSFVGYVVEIRQVFAETAFVLTLLQYILAFKPIPSLVYFSKVLNDQTVALDSFFPFAKDTKTFGVDPEIRIDFTW